MSFSRPLAVSLSIGAVGALVILIRRSLLQTPKISPKPEVYKKDYTKDVVYLYQFKRLANCPNLSPFCMKVEVFLRAYKIPYEICDEELLWSRNGTLPFVELNGEHIADSDLIAMRLKEHFKMPNMSEAQEAHAVAVTRLADNHLMNILIRYAMMEDDFFRIFINIMGIPNFLIPILTPFIKADFIRKAYKRSTLAIGDFEPAEMEKILYKDLQTIQDTLRDHKFLFGESVTVADASVFAHLGSVIYPFRSHINEVLEKDFPRILEYCERIREEIYPNDFTL